MCIILENCDDLTFSYSLEALNKANGVKTPFEKGHRKIVLAFCCAQMQDMQLNDLLASNMRQLYCYRTIQIVLHLSNIIHQSYLNVRVIV